jgi:hypothetical protein
VVSARRQRALRHRALAQFVRKVGSLAHEVALATLKSRRTRDGTTLAPTTSMSAHLKGVVILLLVTALAIAAGMLWSPYVGYAVVAVSITVWFVVSIAWMRPGGFQEHDGPRPWFRRKTPR